MDRLVLVVLISAFAVLGSNAFECYVCNDCATVTDSHIKTCGTTTTSSTSSTTSTTTAPTSTSTSTTTAAPSEGTSSSSTADSSSSSSSSTSTSTSTTSTTVAPEDNIETMTDLGHVKRFKRSILSDNSRVDPEFSCVKAETTVGGATVIVRGCAVTGANNSVTCTNIGLPATCSVCTTEKCNGSSTIFFSIPLMIVMILSISI